MKVNGKDYPIYIMENKNVWNHQPVIYTTVIQGPIPLGYISHEWPFPPNTCVRSSKYPTSRDILTSQKVTMADSHFQPAQNQKSLGIVIPRQAKDQTWIYFGIPFGNLKIALENYPFYIVRWFFFSKMPMIHSYSMSILSSVDAVDWLVEACRHHAVSTVSGFPTNISHKCALNYVCWFIVSLTTVVKDINPNVIGVYLHQFSSHKSAINPIFLCFLWHHLLIRGIILCNCQFLSLKKKHHFPMAIKSHYFHLFPISTIPLKSHGYWPLIPIFDLSLLLMRSAPLAILSPAGG